MLSFARNFFLSTAKNPDYKMKKKNMHLKLPRSSMDDFWRKLSNEIWPNEIFSMAVLKVYSFIQENGFPRI